jgi:mono/diheme cytochrome c family protein
LLLLAGAVWGVFASGWLGKQSAKPDPAVEYRTQVQPLLKQYCHDCHNDQKRKGGLSLDGFTDIAAVRTNRVTWADVMRKVKQQEMPPEGKAQPTPVERDRLVGWIEAVLFPVDPAHPDPGRVTIRRLNRSEYNNTIRDLVGVTLRPADDFPGDDTGYGFDTVGDALSVSPLLLERYLTAAERVLDAAILDEDSRKPPTRVFLPADFHCAAGGDTQRPDLFCLFSQGEVVVTNELSLAGEYRVGVLAYGDQAGSEPVNMAVRVDGQTVASHEVKAVTAQPGLYETTVKLAAGAHRLGAAFLNDYYNPNESNPAKRDRNLYIHRLSVTGPLDAPPPALPEIHRSIFVCTPEPGTTNECLRTIIERFARRAFRRPVAAQETERLVQLALRTQAEGASFEKSVKAALQAVLVSPHFLFRGELQPNPDNPRTVSPVDDYALASRLSYFLWSTMPDEELFSLAAKGKLRKQLRPQVRRMLRDPKAQALVDNFAGQWLQIRNLQTVAPDPMTFPGFDDSLRSAMARETELFFSSLISTDASILDLLNADYTFVNERLARHYGLAGVRGPEFRRVSLAGLPRRGVLTHAAVLTLTSNPTRTSPVKRGKWVLENLLAQPPPPPPPGVPPLGEGKEAMGSASLRQRMELHREDPMCASCHALMDPIGFSLENFDGIGRWREKDGTFAIDASGRLPGGDEFSGALGLREVLATKRGEQFVRCLGEKLLTYALGRGMEYYDRVALDQIVKQVKAGNYRFSALAFAITESVPFQMRRGEGDPWDQ